MQRYSNAPSLLRRRQQLEEQQLPVLKLVRLSTVAAAVGVLAVLLRHSDSLGTASGLTAAAADNAEGMDGSTPAFIWEYGRTGLPL